MNISSTLPAAFAVILSLGASLWAADLPPELPLWQEAPPEQPIRTDVEEQMRSVQAPPGSLSGMNRAFSSVVAPTYSIHRPKNPNGVGLVICPGGGFRDVWLDREGHDLAIWLKDHNVTCLVLKYRTFVPGEPVTADTWPNCFRAAQADGRQAIRILRKNAADLGLQPDKIGISGFSAGGHLALNCSLRAEPEASEGQVSGMPDFAGLFYPGIPEDIGQLMEDRIASASTTPDICPMFMVNARVDKLTPVDKLLDFYTMLLKAEVNAELHVFSTGAHGFGLGDGRGQSTALWPTSFAAWLHDANIIQE